MWYLWKKREKNKTTATNNRIEQKEIQCEKITTNKSTFTHKRMEKERQKKTKLQANDNVAMSKQLIG